ncbi:MAG: (2Fe-2S)-binding protein [Alphaproteobacteria bacterium]
MSGPQFHRLGAMDRPLVRISIDGKPHDALAGDTVLTALLTVGRHARGAEFGDGPRAGLCIMGVCQDCWVTLAGGQRLRACTTPVAAGMAIETGIETDHVA